MAVRTRYHEDEASCIFKIIPAFLVAFSASVFVMVIGCPLGIPGRLPFDGVNVALQISFMTSVVRICRRHPVGGHYFALAWPHGVKIRLSVLKPIAVAALWTVLPGLIVMVPVMLYIAPFVTDFDNIVATVVSRVGPMYIICGIWAWRIAATQKTAPR